MPRDEAYLKWEKGKLMRKKKAGRPMTPPTPSPSRELLRTLWELLPQIDNGICAICRLQGDHGYRTYDGKGRPGKCENQECLSHEVTARKA